MPDREWCGCVAPVTLRAGTQDIVDECREFLREPSRDELSDICFGVGRLLGTLTGAAYRRVPFAGPHITKIVLRMDEHGCVRSRRHLRDGHCPSR